MTPADSSPELSDHQDAITVTAAQKKEDQQRRAVAFKITHILVALFLTWLLVIQAAGLFLFSRGFLLNRLVLEDQSTCDVLPNGQVANPLDDACWHPRAFKRAVILVIDALRYDFTIPFQPSEQIPIPLSYHNNLPFMYNTVIEHPEKAFLLPFIADPPTSTSQRLKGLTAGNLPTFIDVGSNFAGAAIEEDNILVQLKALNKTIVHLGDDTWHQLFPGYFDQNLTHSYDSFNVWDLHTVDNGVIEHIFPLLNSQSETGWDIIFAHCLGVDHAGHWYGPEHPTMAEKLKQMDAFVAGVASNIDKDTVLMVFGDHGMDKKGDHGGESDEEVQAALWVYSDGVKFGRRSKEDLRPPHTAKERYVEQVDLVSTLSLLLGLPIPFNNLGRPIKEAFYRHIPASTSDEQNLASLDGLVYDQIRRYQDRYTASRDFSEPEALLTARQTLQTDISNEEPLRVVSSFEQWHRLNINRFRSLWAEFDLLDMSGGVLLLSFALLFLVVFLQQPDADIAAEVPALLRAAGIGAGTSLLITLLASLVGWQGSWMGTLELIAVGMLASALATLIFKTVRHRKFSKMLSISIWTCMGVFFTISQAAGFASNSYTIHEDTILTFFLGTFGVLIFASSMRQDSGSDRALGTYHAAVFVVLTRIISYSRLCRDEQAPGCRSTFYSSQNSATSAPWQLLLPYVVAIFLPELVKHFYEGTKSYHGIARIWLGSFFRLALLLVALYWTTDAAEAGNWLSKDVNSSTLRTAALWMARIVYVIAVPVGVSIYFWSKPCIDISIVTPTSSSQGDTRPRITILGFANVFGTHYGLMLPVLALCMTVLLPPMGQSAIATCLWQILCLCEMLDTNGLMGGGPKQPVIGPVILAMLGSYHFFKTGHQATLSSIQWNAAYVPLRELRYPWSPILILLNNFGPQILCAAAVPLTVLWKRPISKQGPHGYWSHILQACLAHMSYYAVIQVATTMWAGHLRRHLMLYRVFMPRFLMASGVLIIIDVTLILIALSSARATGSAVAELFEY